MNRLPHIFTKIVFHQRLINFTQFAGPSSVGIKRTLYVNTNCLQQQQKSSGSEKSHGTEKKQKTSPKITLIAPNQTLSVTSLDEAKKLAKRRDLHLVLVQELDTKTHRPVYKLVNAADMLAEELQDLKNEKPGTEKGKKSEKTLTIGPRISDHDLAARQKNISKWLSKQHEVRILIQGSPDDLPNMERICKAIEQGIKEPQLIGKIQQKRTKGSHIKFSIIPIANNSESSTIAPTSINLSNTA